MGGVGWRLQGELGPSCTHPTWGRLVGHAEGGMGQSEGQAPCGLFPPRTHRVAGPGGWLSHLPQCPPLAMSTRPDSGCPQGTWTPPTPTGPGEDCTGLQGGSKPRPWPEVRGRAPQATLGVCPAPRPPRTPHPPGRDLLLSSGRTRQSREKSQGNFNLSAAGWHVPNLARLPPAQPQDQAGGPGWLGGCRPCSGKGPSLCGGHANPSGNLFSSPPSSSTPQQMQLLSACGPAESQSVPGTWPQRWHLVQRTTPMLFPKLGNEAQRGKASAHWPSSRI